MVVYLYTLTHTKLTWSWVTCSSLCSDKYNYFQVCRQDVIPTSGMVRHGLVFKSGVVQYAAHLLIVYFVNPYTQVKLQFSCLFLIQLQTRTAVQSQTVPAC